MDLEVRIFSTVLFFVGVATFVKRSGDLSLSKMSFSSQISHPLTDDIAEMISRRDEEQFSSLALRLFQFQYQHNLPYQRYVDSRHISWGEIHTWEEIPAVPTRAFKISKGKLSCFPDLPAKKFLTSGTTTEIKGEHHFPCTRLYEHSIRETLNALELPKIPSIHFLAPSPAEAPYSSLSHMFGTLEGDQSAYLLRESKFQLAPLDQASEPIFLMGTALAFLHLMESHAPIPLPAGSHLLETGGYKGTSRSLSKDALYRQLADFFSIPEIHLHNEYGMTELSTQAYATGPDGAHHFPSWCQARVIDPESGNALPPGQAGYLRLYDLANAYTVAAIQTQDLAIANADGSFYLLGRDSSALPRGCSRSIDDSLSS